MLGRGAPAATALMIEEFMTAPLVILLQHTPSRDQRAKSNLFQSTWKLCCRDSHKTQVWLCFFTLSLLTSCISASRLTNTQDLQTCLKHLKGTIEKSDAMLYSPPIPLTDRCQHQVLQCYMLELRVIFEEEEIADTNDVQCFYHFNKTLLPERNCPECETHPLKNSNEFFKGLMDLLQQIHTKNTL